MKKKITATALAAVIAATGISTLSAGVSAEEPASFGLRAERNTGKSAKDGWVTKDGRKYYYRHGKALTGWKKINGDTYYFSPSKNGQMLTSWVKMGTDKYYFGSDGVMRTGWIMIDGKSYYFGSDGVMRTGTVKTGVTVYKFGDDGALISAKADIPWDSSIDDITDMLDEKGVRFVVQDDEIYTYESKTYGYVYSFDDKGRLKYLILFDDEKGRSEVESLRKQLRQQGYKLQDREEDEDEGTCTYYYASSDSVIVTGTGYSEARDVEYMMTVYISPEYSKQIIRQGISSFGKALF